MSKTALNCDWSEVDALQRNPRAGFGHLHRVYLDEGGMLRSELVLTVRFSRPKDWATGTWKVGISDYSTYPGTHCIGSARGCGQDMFAACTEGLTALGVEFGDHGDYKGRPTFHDWLDGMRYGTRQPGQDLYIWDGDFYP